MVFPLFMALTIPVVGWRTSLAMNAVVLLLVLIPALRAFPLREFAEPVEGDSPAPRTNAQWGLLKDPMFRSLAPAAVGDSIPK